MRGVGKAATPSVETDAGARLAFFATLTLGTPEGGQLGHVIVLNQVTPSPSLVPAKRLGNP
jgi:hypothetical protein